MWQRLIQEEQQQQQQQEEEEWWILGSSGRLQKYPEKNVENIPTLLSGIRMDTDTLQTVEDLKSAFLGNHAS